MEQTPISNPSPKNQLLAAVFLSGLVLMALEMVGARVLAPFLGSSIYIWSSLIGVILASLSLGYYWGGKLADDNPAKEFLSVLFLCASALTSIILFLDYPLLSFLSSKNLDLRISGPLAALLMFGAPSLAIGTLLPYASRLLLADLEHSGRTVGQLYAVSTAGSLLGTFLGGFVLSAYLGTAATIALLSAALWLASLIVDLWHKLAWKILIALLLLSVYLFHLTVIQQLATAGIIDLDTAYHRVLVITKKRADDERKMRMLVTDTMGSQSTVYLDAPYELSGEYTNFYPLAFLFNPQIKRILILGGGAYTVPKYFASHYPGISVDVVEIDPGLTNIARKLFFLNELPNLHIINQDARSFCRTANQQYDLVLLDAFASAPSVPFHLTTVEAMRDISRLLSANGVLMMNLISSVGGPQGRFFRAEYLTFKAVFPQVMAFPVHEPQDAESVQNIILVAFKAAAAPSFETDNPSYRKLLAQHWSKEIASDTAVLTDDYAPVEYYLLPALLRWQEQLRSARAAKGL